MTKEEVALIAASAAAFTSLISLFLNSKLTFNRDKRMLHWEKEVARLHELEEQIGIAQEVVLVYSGIEELKRDFIPLHENLKYVAGRFAKYPELAKSIRGFVHACDLVVHTRMEHGDDREYRNMVQAEYGNVINECSQILNPKTSWFCGIFGKRT